MLPEVKISVRALAEYAHRSGSIESGFKTSISFTEGSRIHRDVQKNYTDGDLCEVFLKASVEFEQLLFVIEGRCDGLLNTNEHMVIDEIKSTALPLDSIDENSYPAHWAQADCYAYMYLQDHKTDCISVQLTYVQKISGEIKRFKKTRTREELYRNVLYLIKCYAPYARMRLNHELERNISIKNLSFPYESYRKGQRRLAAIVYKTIVDRQTLFVTAPTGIGKTISTTFPAIKGIGEGKLNKIFYLTAKTTTSHTGVEAFKRMINNGLSMKIVAITAKEKICFTKDGVCSQESCMFADGFYDRINQAVLDILQNEQILDRSCIEKYSLKHTVCPFEFSLILAYSADAVICDYNYIFDPVVSLKRLADEDKSKTVLLVDEAHNLVDRARDMFSAELQKSVFLKLKQEFKGKDPYIFESAKKLNTYFIRQKHASPTHTNIFKTPDLPFDDAVEEFVERAEQKLANGELASDLLLETYFACQKWVRVSKLFNEEFVQYFEKNGNEMRVKKFCLDPSKLINKAVKSFNSRVFFSATLSPFKYFTDMLGSEEGNYFSSIPSPFSKEQSDVFIKPLSTRYHDRGESILSIIETIEHIVKTKPGKYLIFFPSYQYLNNVAEEWRTRNKDIETIQQWPAMEETDRDGFLNYFQEGSPSLVGFAVLGGIFSEGIDLKGDRLNGVIITGVGLPQIGFERNLIKQYFSNLGKNGYDYAYVYPGMNKVLQAGGRLIRSETDKGTIILIDDRYLQYNYQEMLPDGWKDFTLI